jgi:hypothetical protein
VSPAPMAHLASLAATQPPSAPVAGTTSPSSSPNFQSAGFNNDGDGGCDEHGDDIDPLGDGNAIGSCPTGDDLEFTGNGSPLCTGGGGLHSRIWGQAQGHAFTSKFQQASQIVGQSLTSIPGSPPYSLFFFFFFLHPLRFYSGLPYLWSALEILSM